MSKSKEEQLKERYAEQVIMHIDSFGLGRWAVTIEGWDDELDPLDMAVSSVNVPGRCASFYINTSEIIKEFGDMAEHFVDRAALHEVTHLLTSRLSDLAMRKRAVQEDLDEEIEAIAVAMEKFVFGQAVVL